MPANKKGISVKQLQRTIGVTYKTVWRISQQICKAMRHSDFEDKLCGTVEVDDNYIGGKHSDGKRGGDAPGKGIVVGIKERNSQMRAVVIEDLKAYTLKSVLVATVELEAELLVTDGFSNCKVVAKGCKHKTVMHSQATWTETCM